MVNQHERREKITRMKLQTAKVLWHEERKDAAFLLLESIDDSRGDELRDRMGFSDDHEVGMSTKGSGISFAQLGAAIAATAVIFFFIGFLISSGNGGNVIVETTPDSEQVIETIVAPTPAPGETLSQSFIDMTATADLRQPTVNSVRTQTNIQDEISLTRTAL
jgi:hypothetical protein